MKWIVGIDEVGRGPLAGPVTVCAAAIPATAYKKVLLKNEWSGLNDSKKMTPDNRLAWQRAARAMETRGALLIATTNRTAKQIDTKGIAVCIRECIAANLDKLGLDPKQCVVLLDGGLKAPEHYKQQRTIIRGDGSEKIISLASVVAKVQRDHFMVALHRKHPSYDWSSNKGYGTRAHIRAIKKEGPTSFHRMSFLKNILTSKAGNTRRV